MVASTSGFAFIFEMTNISEVLFGLTQHFGLSTVWEELVVSMVAVAAAIFSLLGGPCADRFGRKPTIMFAASLCTVGPILLGAAQNKEMLLIGRIVEGAGMGAFIDCNFSNAPTLDTQKLVFVCRFDSDRNASVLGRMCTKAFARQSSRWLHCFLHHGCAFWQSSIWRLQLCGPWMAVSSVA